MNASSPALPGHVAYRRAVPTPFANTVGREWHRLPLLAAWCRAVPGRGRTAFPGRALAAESLSHGHIRSVSWRASHPGPWRCWYLAAKGTILPSLGRNSAAQELLGGQRLAFRRATILRSTKVGKQLGRHGFWASCSRLLVRSWCRKEEGDGAARPGMVVGARRDGCARPDRVPTPKPVSFQVRTLESKCVGGRFTFREGFQRL